MILKLGYTDTDGVNVFRYIDSFTDLKITSYLTGKYVYNREGAIVVYGKQHEVQGVDLMFTPKILEEYGQEEVYVTYVYYLDTSTATHIAYACLPDSVFLMNDNGKTIDKY